MRTAAGFSLIPRIVPSVMGKTLTGTPSVWIVITAVDVRRQDLESDIPFHCGNACPIDGLNIESECPQEHWCPCCGDCMYCFNDECYDGCSVHGYIKRIDY